MPTLYLIDCFSLIFQVFHAIPSMNAPDGRPMNAVYGFTRDLLMIIERNKPTYLVCVFDPKGPTFRDEMYASYKANRGPMPDDLRPQIDLIRSVIESMNVPLVEVAGFEADDVIATLATRAEADGLRTFVCTSDKDARQLISAQITMYNIRKDMIYDHKALMTDWGVHPEQVVDFMAMTGDSVDNVPGIAGVGPKTATALMQEFGSLEAIFQNVDSIKGKKRQENIRNGQEAAALSRELVALRRDVPIELEWEQAIPNRFDAPKLSGLFQEFGFRRLTEEFSLIAATETDFETTHRIVIDAQEFAQVISEGRTTRRIAIHGLMVPGKAGEDLAGLALCVRAGESVYVPLLAPVGESVMAKTSFLKVFRELFLDSPDDVTICGHNLKRLCVWLDSPEIIPSSRLFDIMVADYLLEAGERTHDLEQLARRYFFHNIVSDSDLGIDKKVTAGDVPLMKLAPAAGERVDVVFRLCEKLTDLLMEQELNELYCSLEGPLIGVLAEMELAGIRLDVELLKRMSTQFAEQLESTESKIFTLAGHEFNIASPIQLREVLFEELNLPVLKRTKTGASTNQEVLEELALQHELPALLIEHRQIAKLKSTYVDALPRLVNPVTGRIHATFNQVVAATGRLSSSDPNLQNIPIRTEQGRQIRQAIVADAPGESLTLFDERQEAACFVSADYSQIELRVMAHFSQDPELLKAFEEDRDIHRFVAASLAGVPESEVDTTMRRNAKMVNFGVIYGLSPFGLANRLGIPKPEAEEFIRSYFERYIGVDRFIHDTLAEAHRQNYVTTILGRRRRITGVRKEIGKSLNQPEREAVNTVIQGSAADMIKKAMVNLHRRFTNEQTGWRMVLQIHDELVFEGPKTKLDQVAGIVRDEMVQALPLRVPILVDVSTGPNLLELSPWTDC